MWRSCVVEIDTCMLVCVQKAESGGTLVLRMETGGAKLIDHRLEKVPWESTLGRPPMSRFSIVRHFLSIWIIPDRRAALWTKGAYTKKEYQPPSVNPSNPYKVTETHLNKRVHIRSRRGRVRAGSQKFVQGLGKFFRPRERRPAIP